MAPMIEQLERMSDAEVRALYNERAKNVSEGLERYREELRRREAKRQANTLRNLTWLIAGLTALNAVVRRLDDLRPVTTNRRAAG